MNILKPFLLFLLLMMLSLSQPIKAQNNDNNNQTNDTIKPARVPVNPYIRLGIDVSSVMRNILEPEVQQYEISFDTGIKLNWFATAEAGFMNVSSERETFAYKSNGYFLRLGAEYNLLNRKPDPDKNNLVLIGARYGYSFLQHRSPFFFVENEYWGDHTGSINSSFFNLHWMELTGGVKTEVLPNLFLGWTIRVRVRIFGSRDPELQPYYIPGFGHGDRTNPATVLYSIMYRFKL